MDTNLLTELNSRQREAATFSKGNLLVLAGAGSGKTRVLVHRIAWLLRQGLELRNILAVTFTNKAAQEMRGRLEEMLQRPSDSLWIGTFHGLANRLLRLHWQEAGLSESFQIMDSDDQSRLLKRVYGALDLNQERWPLKQAQAYINRCKEDGLRPGDIQAAHFNEKTWLRVYQAYEELCQRSGLIDFAELLLRACELLRRNPQIGSHYQSKFQHILVDEFQDTNAIQYRWIKLLYGSKSRLTVVGDDDQSIYGWRGADSENMQKLSRDYSDMMIIRLEQNYRSTANILDAANALIAHNRKRLGKQLWTAADSGGPIKVYAAFNEVDEADYLARTIKDWVGQERSWNEVAVLYRSNAQSRVIEERLLQAGIPYRVYGGIRFFERSEIKDVLAYLRLLINRNDDAAFERVVNLPVRGVGDTTLKALREQARINQHSLWAVTQQLLGVNPAITGKAASGLAKFVQLIEQFDQQVSVLSLGELVAQVINGAELKQHYAKPQYLDRQSRQENLDELITAAQQFVEVAGCGERREELRDFLTQIALEPSEQRAEQDSSVKLMTLHAAKGLEFPLVLLCGMEEGLFPHIMASDTPEGLEEERRLCYVGMTRAMEQLYLLYAESRRVRGVSSFCRISRFLNELPKQLVVQDSSNRTGIDYYSDNRANRSPIGWSASSAKQTLNRQPKLKKDHSQSYNGLTLGQTVMHQGFGEGVITGFEGEGEYTLVKVRFRQHGDKLLAPKYARLQVVN